MDYNRYFNNYTGEKGNLVYLIDKVRLAEKTFDTVFTDFLNPEDQNILRKMCQDKFLKVDFYGGKGEFERAVASLFKYELEGEYPIDVIKINGNFKFEKLNHRDYLGAVLALGIKREKVGDINVFENETEIYVHRDISSYIAMNLNKIKHTGIKINLINISDAKEKEQKFIDIKVNVSSPRIDCVVSSALNISRSKAAEMLGSGDVKVNYSITYDVSDKIKLNDIISIKGCGRFKIEDILGVTKSDRLTLLIKKYQ